MTRNGRTGLWLTLAGIGGILFFWLTDPRWGVARYSQTPQTLLDAAGAALPGTIVGLIGSAAVLAVGLWLMSRRSV